MNIIVAALVGFLAGRMLWLAMRKSWHRQPLMRKNFQGVSLPTAAGLSITLSLLLVEAGRALFGAAGIGDNAGLTPMRAATVVVVLGFSMLGLIDDLVGKTGTKGLAGHLKALFAGELTSGAMKMFGGVAVAIVGAAFVTHSSLGSLLVSAAIIALTANLANLFDLRPGRTTKIGVFAFVLLAIGTGMTAELVPIALVVGAAAALVLDDLHERLMLGDTGSNALGAAIGLGFASQLGGTGRIVALVALLALNLLSEIVSFSKVINGFAPLRKLDEMGRRKQTTIDVRDEKVGVASKINDDEPSAAPFRAQASSMRATVEGAHVGGSTGSRAGDQIASPPNDSRDRAATRPFGGADESGSSDLFGFDKPSTLGSEFPRSGRGPFDDDEDSGSSYRNGPGSN